VPKQHGHLVIVGGPADRPPDRDILARAAHLAGGASARVAILVFGAKPDDDKVALFTRSVETLGVASVVTHRVLTRAEADSSEVVEAIANATCTLLIGSDPQTLARVLRGSPLESEIHQAFERRGACVVAIGGAASAVSRQMVTEGKNDIHPRAGLIALAPGLAFLDRIVIDHHFSEKQRMGRLLSIVAQAPEYLGVGIDAQTALLVSPKRRLEVIGRATVTILDGRSMSYCTQEASLPGDILAMGNVQLHLLPAGFTFDLKGGLPPARGVVGPKVPPALHEVAALMVSSSPNGPVVSAV
jgi:cyanophycinase